jgi:hypothetical protein
MIIIVIALFYTAKVYWFKELKLCLVSKRAEKFEIIDLKTVFLG